MMHDDLIAIASRAPRGRRPQFCEDPLTEQLFGVTLGLATELAVTRQRLATLERVLAGRGLLDEDIERWQPEAADNAADSAALDELLARVFRPLIQDAVPLPATTAPAALASGLAKVI